MSENVLDIHGLCCGYGESMVVRGVSLDVKAGEIFTLLGKNGMGKTTLLGAVMGYLPIREGRVSLLGEDIDGQPTYRIARKPIAYAAQEQALFPDLTVERNLMLGLRAGRSLAREMSRIEAVFPIIASRLEQRAGTLSGGEQKMLLVARAVLNRPRLILMDEISEGMQPSVIERLAATLRRERDEAGTSILLIEQNVQFALSVADRYATLERGEIVDRGSARDPSAATRILRQLSI